MLDPTLALLVPAATCQLEPGQLCPGLAVTIQDLAILALVQPHPTMSPSLLTQTPNKIGGVTDSVFSYSLHILLSEIHSDISESAMTEKYFESLHVG